MRPFELAQATDPATAVQNYASRADVDTRYLAGGTTLVDLMKLDVMRPSRVISINEIGEEKLSQISLDGGSLRLGALTRMSDAAAHSEIRKRFPLIAQSLELAASPQIRNMASLGGNVLQRTRCSYFRDTSYPNCNKRSPGSGCAALDGVNRSHAVLGASEHCIATYPGDFAQALIALDATVEILGRQGVRTSPFAKLHVQPGLTPNLETTLAAGELITAFVVPDLPFARRSLYLKIRDRASYEFALASAAVAIDLDGRRVRDIRIALGGVATTPWRSREAEDALRDKDFDMQSAEGAADAAFSGAKGRSHNVFKIALGKKTLVRALNQVAALEI